MKKDSVAYTYIFALIVCVICSFLLSFVSEGLRDKKELNVALDMKKNILKAVQLKEPLEKGAEQDKILEIYKNKIQEMVLDQDGNVVEGKTPLEIEEGSSLMALYEYVEDGDILAYAFPIIGKGLWSTLKGYLAIEPDGSTIRGITFYSHGETPGLGAEIEKEWFTSNFEGKKIWDVKQNELRPVSVVKGKVEDKYSGEEKDFYVDGISGATMTSKGVTAMIEKEVNQYETFFSKMRKN